MSLSLSTTGSTMPERELNPSPAAVPETGGDDPRLGQLLGRRVARPEDARVVLVGFPSDEGVRLNGGRPGAAQAPEAIRAALYRLTPDPRRSEAFTRLAGHTVDLGDVALSGGLEEDQGRLGKVLAPHLRRGAVPIVLGGGHETAYGHFLGYVAAARHVSILNWDAHPDVRPLKDGRAHSGSPFRQALEHPSGTCAGYTVAGLLPHSTARSHLRFIEAQGGQCFWKEELRAPLIDSLYAGSPVPCMATFDLDAVDQAAAPGVSAPAADGLSPALWLHAAACAGRSPHVTSMDLVELNPKVDADGRTARLAALTVWHFLSGLAER